MENITVHKICDDPSCMRLAENQCDACRRWYCSSSHSIYDAEQKIYLCLRHADPSGGIDPVVVVLLLILAAILVLIAPFFVR